MDVNFEFPIKAEKTEGLKFNPFHYKVLSQKSKIIKFFMVMVLILEEQMWI